jgi:hypothetical protein
VALIVEWEVYQSTYFDMCLEIVSLKVIENLLKAISAIWRLRRSVRRSPYDTGYPAEDSEFLMCVPGRAANMRRVRLKVNLTLKRAMRA